tara:strand:+ start:420 stop:644 length:225 start_codon:yes stop_codon:yes gene_type:complete
MNLQDLIRIKLELSKQITDPLVPPLMVDEEFIIPQPKPKETQSDYVGRCMGAIGNENKPHEQLLAICISTYKNK